MQIVVEEAGDWESDSRSCSCAPSLNCHRWLLNLSGDDGKVLLEYSGIGLLPLNSRGHGYRDIVTGYNAQLGRLELTIWRFDGSRYLAFRCATKSYDRRAINSEYSDQEIDKTGTISEHSCTSR